MRLGLVALAVLAASCTRPVQLMNAPDGTFRPAVDAGPPPVVVRADDEPGELRGSWTGVGHQSDGGSWPMRLDLTGGSGQCATIAYPTVPCRGVWECQRGEDASGWREAQEKIQGGSCIDGGTFRYRLRGDSLEWTWFKKPQPGRHADEDELTAHGVLTRTEAAPTEPNWDIDEE